MENLDHLFPSFCITFKSQADFNKAVELKDCACFTDISWSERIITFDDIQERQSFISLLTSPSVGIKEINLDFSED